MNYLIGHLVGDYLLQNDWMALNKKAMTFRGWLACLIHCFLYSVAVCAFTGWWDARFIIVMLSHLALDKTLVVVWYMRLTGSFKRIITDKNNPSAIWACAIVDNTFHMVTLYLINMM